MERRAAQGTWLLHQMVKKLCLGSPLNCPASLHAACLAAPPVLPQLCCTQSFHWGGWKFVKLLVVTSTQKRAVTHHNDTLSSRAVSQHCKAPLEKYKLSGWKNWDTELATLKTQLSLKAVTSYQFSFFTSILPIIFENLCQILHSLVIGLQRIIKCCKSLSPLGITQVIVWLHSITELNNEDR